MASQGYAAGTRVLSTKITGPDRTTQQALHLTADDFVIEIQRVRLADGSPISLETAEFPAEAFPGLLEKQLGGSIYQILETEYGLVTSRAEERIEAVNATPDEAALLGVKPQAALLLINRITYDQNGTPCEFSRDLSAATALVWRSPCRGAESVCSPRSTRHRSRCRVECTPRAVRSWRPPAVSKRPV